MDLWLGVRVLNQALAVRRVSVGLQRRRCGRLRGEAEHAHPIIPNTHATIVVWSQFRSRF
jgi:hypothetical protein